ncbi:MAG: hypothetical protein WDA21_05800 [Bacilli bacterium]
MIDYDNENIIKNKTVLEFYTNLCNLDEEKIKRDIIESSMKKHRVEKLNIDGEYKIIITFETEEPCVLQKTYSYKTEHDRDIAYEEMIR